MTALWTSSEIAAATGGVASAPFEVEGVTFDSREVGPGDLFVAMPGTVADGHEFVAAAYASGATGALVSHPVDGPHILVPDVAAALTALAIEARRRVEATIIGVTGSVGKTSTKEALADALERSCRCQVHRSVKSYNNHTGVPLSLARMPRDTLAAVFEMGMNHAGEIAVLTRLVRPNIAIITAIAPAHIETLGTIEAIAAAKAEIFEGLEPDGVAIVPEDTDQRDLLVNGDFSAELSHWFMTSDRNHLPWHIKNVFANVALDQGLVGLALWSALVFGALARVTLGTARTHPLAPGIAGGLAGFLAVGIFDSLLDVPRVAFLFYFLVLLGLTLKTPRLRPSAPPAI